MTEDALTNADLAARAVRLLGDRDFAGMREIASPDVVLEFPFHPTGAQIHRGVDAMIDQFSVIKVFETLTIDIVDVFDTGGETVIVEGRSHGRYRRSDRPDYDNHYLFVLTLVEGRIARWREFYNPLELMKQGSRPRSGETPRGS